MARTEGNRFSNGVNRDDIVKAVFNNDCKLISEMLEGFHFNKDGPLHPIVRSAAANQLVIQILTAASMAASKQILANETADTIIQYIRYNVDIFKLLYQVEFYFGGDSDGYHKLPKKVTAKLKTDDPTDFESEITILDEEQTKIFVNFVNSDIESLDCSFTPPVIKKLREFIPDCLLFGLIATKLHDPMPDIGIGMIGLGSLMSMFE